MIISIMKNIDLSALVSIANDPFENEVDGVPTTAGTIEDVETTEKPTLTLGQLLTGESAFTTVETKVLETEPVSTFPSVENPTTEVRRDESQLTTTNNDDEANTAANVRVEDGVHVVLPVGWFENEEDRKQNEAVQETTPAPVVEETTTTTTVATTAPATTTTAEAETAADILTTIAAEIPNVTEERIATTLVSNEESAAAEQLTTISNEVVEIVHAEGVSTTVASAEVEITLTTTNAVTTDIPETVRGGKKLPRVFRPRSRTSTTSSTTQKTTTTEDEAAEDGEERPRFANQRNRIRQRLRSQFTGSTSATKALEILNTRARSEQKEQKEKAEDTEVEVEAEEGSGGEEFELSPKVKKDRMKLNVTKLVDRRNELFKKRVPITHPPPVKEDSTVSTESAPAAAAAKPIFRNPSRRPFKFSSTAEAVIPSELTATETVSTPSPDSDSAKPKSVRCRLFRRACTDEDLSTTKS